MKRLLFTLLLAIGFINQGHCEVEDILAAAEMENIMGYTLCEQDLLTDHRISRATPEKVMCHITTIALQRHPNVIRSSEKPDESVSGCQDARSVLNYVPGTDCIHCRTNLAGLPIGREVASLDRLARLGQQRNLVPNHTSSPVRELTNEIMRASEAFQVDIGALTSLLGHESGFCKTNSSFSGASGLGQMTRPAFDEIRHQLFGPELGENATPGAVRYFNSMANRLGFSIETLRGTTREDLALERNWKLNLFFSAAVLKVKLAKQNARLGCDSTRSGSRPTRFNRKSIYKKAINGYNGSTQKEQNDHYTGTMCQNISIYGSELGNFRDLPSSTRHCRAALRNNYCSDL